MVKNITHFGRNGLSDWLVQRVSAIVIGMYALFLLVFFLVHPQLTYADWRCLSNGTAFKVASLVVLVCLCAHAWIGIWTVLTDYIKCIRLRLILEILLILLLLSYVAWGLEIFWS